MGTRVQNQKNLAKKPRSEERGKGREGKRREEDAKESCGAKNERKGIYWRKLYKCEKMSKSEKLNKMGENG